MNFWLNRGKKFIIHLSKILGALTNLLGAMVTCTQDLLSLAVIFLGYQITQLFETQALLKYGFYLFTEFKERHKG
jgi:hypothetical protein